MLRPCAPFFMPKGVPGRVSLLVAESGQSPAVRFCPERWNYEKRERRENENRTDCPFSMEEGYRTFGTCFERFVNQALFPYFACFVVQKPGPAARPPNRTCGVIRRRRSSRSCAKDLPDLFLNRLMVPPACFGFCRAWDQANHGILHRSPLFRRQFRPESKFLDRL